MGTRLELQAKLEELLGSRNVYYQPPAGKSIEYPAIIYKKDKIDISKANDRNYRYIDVYTITVVSKRPDNPVISALLELEYCSYGTRYISDNLYHDTLTLYF